MEALNWVTYVISIWQKTNSDVLTAKNTFTQQLIVCFNKLWLTHSYLFYIILCVILAKTFEREEEESNVTGRIFFLTIWQNKEKKKIRKNCIFEGKKF